MRSNTSESYVVYTLHSFFRRQPGDLRACPNCENDISVVHLPPSKVVDDLLAGATIPIHDFSVLYECKSCHWWAIRESWGDLEGNYSPDNLVVIYEKSVSDASQTSNQGAPPWGEILKDEHLYDKVLPLPDKLGRFFAEHNKRF